MNLRKIARVVVLVALAACFAGCHFHGGHCHGIDFSWSHCRPHRHCR
jgi:hypothetical protein